MMLTVVVPPSYDCFYLKSGGEFKGNGDGGFINVR